MKICLKSTQNDAKLHKKNMTGNIH